jgi:hypothetical protein
MAPGAGFRSRDHTARTGGTALAAVPPARRTSSNCSGRAGIAAILAVGGGAPG